MNIGSHGGEDKVEVIRMNMEAARYPTTTLHGATWILILNGKCPDWTCKTNLQTVFVYTMPCNSILLQKHMFILRLFALSVLRSSCSIFISYIKTWFVGWVGGNHSRKTNTRDISVLSQQHDFHLDLWRKSKHSSWVINFSFVFM